MAPNRGILGIKEGRWRVEPNLNDVKAVLQQEIASSARVLSQRLPQKRRKSGNFPNQTTYYVGSDLAGSQGRLNPNFWVQGLGSPRQATTAVDQMHALGLGNAGELG